MGYKLDLKHPRTFNEKLQWLKLNDRKPEYTLMVDKYRVKEWVAKKIGEEYVIPTLAVWESVDDIDISELPSRFVLKCNHDSGSVIVCHDKASFDLETAKKKLGAAMEQNFYWLFREWPYKNVKKCIFAEEYLEDKEDDALLDYKWFIFNGEPKVMYISRDRGKTPRTNFYDMDFRLLPIRMVDPNMEEDLSKPSCFDEMKDLSVKLSVNSPFVRTDFYVVNNHVYFGEFTFFHNGGFVSIDPSEWNKKMGDWLDLGI